MVSSLGFFFLWIAVGSVVFAAAFLASCLLESDYSALTASILAFYIYPLVVARTAFLRPYRLHIHYIMNGTGMPYLDPRTHALVGPLPWTTLGVLVLVTAAFLGGGAMMLARMDFS